MSFDSQYQKLNSAQKAAVDAIDGPVMVIAGPGTGKTHILTLRIANILQKTQVNPSNILALTFTDSASKTMRTRLQKLIGIPASSVRIETFHSLCDSIIREYPEYFPFARGAQPLSQIEQMDAFRTLLNNPNLTYLRTPGSKYHYIHDLVSAISTLKREGIAPERFSEIVNDEVTWFAHAKLEMKKSELLKWEPLIGKHQEMVDIYAGYQHIVASSSRYDFDDMLLETLRVLQTNELLLGALQEQFQYLLVDEYQDTNGVQNALVDSIASFWDEPNLFVVGDPNQTIFRFQGAALENTLGFLDRYPKATIITLKQGYRSNQLVYDSAHTLVSPTHSHADHPLMQALELPLLASHTRGDISLSTTLTDTDELLLLVQRVQALLQQDESPQDIAILYKRNSDGETLADLFTRSSIPFHTERDVNVLQDPLLTQFFVLLSLVHALASAAESRVLFDVLHFDWFEPQGIKLSHLFLLKLIRSFATQKTVSSPYDFILQPESALKSLVQLKTAGKNEFENLHHIGDILAQWVSQSKKLTFPEFIELLARESGFLPNVEKSLRKESLENFIVLFREITRLAKATPKYSLADFLGYLTTMNEQGLTLSRNSTNESNSVTLATVHKAKGREWKHVFLPFFREKYWGKSRGKPGITLPEGIVTHALAAQVEDSDERRLLFVAFTRSKQYVYISYSQTLRDGDQTRDILPSPYIHELENLVPTTPTINPELGHLFLEPITSTIIDSATREWLQALVHTLPLSYSSLNTYLEDPKKFFERYILKLPEAVQPHLAFGNAIHRTLEWYFNQYLESHTHPSLKQTLDIFDKLLVQEILTPNDFLTRTNQGHAALTAFLEKQREQFPHTIATEESFGWRRGKILVNDVELSGKIDRIDMLDDDHTLRVIDYKTGKSKTMGDIEGTTQAAALTAREKSLPKGIQGRMKRQLLFYKLLLSLDPKYKTFKLDQGIFVFVEPVKGEFVVRSITLLESDVKDLVQLILEVAAEIRELKFLDKT